MGGRSSRLRFHRSEGADRFYDADDHPRVIVTARIGSDPKNDAAEGVKHLGEDTRKPYTEREAVDRFYEAEIDAQGRRRGGAEAIAPSSQRPLEFDKVTGRADRPGWLQAPLNDLVYDTDGGSRKLETDLGRGAVDFDKLPKRPDNVFSSDPTQPHAATDRFYTPTDGLGEEALVRRRTAVAFDIGKVTGRPESARRFYGASSHGADALYAPNSTWGDGRAVVDMGTTTGRERVAGLVPRAGSGADAFYLSPNRRRTPATAMWFGPPAGPQIPPDLRR